MNLQLLLMVILRTTVFHEREQDTQVQTISSYKNWYLRVLLNTYKPYCVPPGVATYCKHDFTPYKAEEGLAGTFSSHTDQINYYDNVHSSFTDEELHDLDAEGRCVMTLHKFKVTSFLFLIIYTVPNLHFLLKIRKKKLK